MNWYFKVLIKYAVFSGRARRKEYWMFALFNFIFSFILSLIGILIGIGRDWDMLSTLYGIIIFLPALGVAVRRLHDTNHTGWWILIALIPLVGAIILLVFMVTDSQSGGNKYGPNPKTGEVTVTTQQATY
jgi:uncharacterized membrane protein YhaH (DUF805 family)